MKLEKRGDPGGGTAMMLRMLWAIWALAGQEGGAAAEDLKLETLRLKNGTQLSGYVAEETPTHLVFKRWFAAPGQRPMAFEDRIELDEVDRYEKRSPAERKRLQERFAALTAAQKKDAARLQAVGLEEAFFPGSTVPARRFVGHGFVLHTDLREPLARELAARLEDLFSMLKRELGPLPEGDPPLPILAFRSQKELHAWKQATGLAFHGLAGFDAKRGQVVAGSDAERYAAELEKVQAEHKVKAEKLEEHFAKLKRHFGGKPPLGGLLQVRAIRLQLQDFELENQLNFDQLKGNWLAAIAHEAARGYLRRRHAKEPPRWLDEGVGQLAAAALPDFGPPQWGRLEAGRLAAAVQDQQGNDLWPIEKLLKANEATLPSSRPAAERAKEPGYVSAWALAHFLACERKLLATPALTEYLRRTGPDVDPRSAFEKLADQPLPEFEKAFRAWLAKAGA